VRSRPLDGASMSRSLHSDTIAAAGVERGLVSKVPPAVEAVLTLPRPACGERGSLIR
jgi:hypothetical protein